MTDGEQKRILLVEDEPVVAMYEARQLERRGYRVEWVQSGEQAVAMLRDRTDIDLILMDIDLGSGMDGTEAAAAIQRFGDVPVVFLSAHTDPEIVERTERVTSYGYVVKNSGITVLDASIKMAFRLYASKKETEAERSRLEASEARFHGLFEQAGDGVLIHDMQGTILDVNQRLCELFGYTPEEFRGLSVLDTHPSGQATDEMVFGIAEELKHDGRSRFETEFVTKTGETFPGEITTAVVDAGDEQMVVGVIRDARDRMQMFQSLRESEARFRSYVEHAPYGVLVAARNGRYIEVNRGYCELTGYGYQEILNKQIGLITAPEARTQAEEQFRAVFDEGYAEAELPYITKKGERRYWNIRAVRISPETALLFVNDTTEYRKAREALDAKQREMQRLFDALPNHIVYKDREGRYQLVNASWARTVGKPRGEILGTLPRDHFPRQEAQGMERHDRDVLSTGEPVLEVEETYETEEGPQTVRSSKIPLWGDHGEVIGLACIEEDITQLKDDERQIRGLLEEKELLLREVHHRVKNNMTTIMSLLEIQAANVGDPTAREALATARNRVGTMMLLYEKLYRSDHLSDRVSLGDYIPSLVAEIVDSFPREVAVHTEAEEIIVPVRVVSSLGLIVNELITNAMKYAFQASQEAALTVTVTEQGGEVTLSVADNGRGFDPESADGGFGLQLVTALAEQLEGRLAIESGGEDGTLCTVTFPR
ncbi:MAG: PAS domain S-box protein [Synergistales bacterium]|nr:PAS domain S-box protein [Synergistales bacterium]